MSEPTTDYSPGFPAGTPPAELNEAEVDSLLDQFRQWLRQTPQLHDDLDHEEDKVDLHTLVGQFTALRHEVNLQTRAVRAQQDQNAETLAQLTQAVRAAKTPTAAADDASRDLLKSLVDLHDTLSVVERELAKADPSLEHTCRQLELPPPTGPALLPEPPRIEGVIPFWAEWFGCGRAMRRALAAYEANVKLELANGAQSLREWHQSAKNAAESAGQILRSMATGFAMNKQRLERILESHGLEIIRCQGEPFDPEVMEVVGTVADSGLAKGMVVDVVRSGYRRQGRLFRCAQVTVAKE